MSNIFTYNSVTLSNLTLESVRSEAVYDGGDQSVMYTKTILSVTGTVYGSGLVANMTSIREALLTPRKDLTVSIDGTSLFDLSAPDDLGGPKPRSCEFTEIINSQFCIIKFEIEVNRQEKCENPENIISHNYSVTHSLDDKFYTTRTVSGIIRVRETAGGGNNNPDALRKAVTFDVPPGFKRDSMIFLVTTDGLQLQYTVVDKEVYRVAPISTVRADGSYGIQRSNMVWYKHFSIEVEGTKLASKLDMFNIAFQIAQSRIDFSSDVVTQSTVEEDLYQNIIRLNFVAMVTSLADVADGTFPQKPNIFIDVPGSETNQNEVLGPYGSALIAAAKKVFYDPCLVAPQNLAISGNGPNGTSPTISTGIIAKTGSPTGSSNNNIGSTQTKANTAYEQYEDSVSAEYDNGISMMSVCLPLASAKIYQHHDPTVIKTHIGHAIRNGQPVDAPKPVLGADDYLLSFRFTPHAPILDADKKTFKYAASWEYKILTAPSSGRVLQTGQYVSSIDSTMMIPANPTTSGSAKTSFKFQGFTIQK